MEPKQPASKKAGTSAKPTRSFALARIESVVIRPDGMREAKYAEYVLLPKEVDIAKPNLGKEPRTNTTNAINAAPPGYLDALQKMSGCDLPVASWALR